MIRMIANPAAGRGRARQVIPVAHAAFAPLGEVELRETARAGDEDRLVAEALDAGCDTIVALGGDGTWSKVVAAIVKARSNCALALIAAGTGNDLAKSIGVPATSPAAVAGLVALGVTSRMDVGFVDDRCFANAAGFGFDVAVLAAASKRRWPSGDALYLMCALDLLFGYRGIDMAVAHGSMMRRLLVVIANGSRFGGSFRIAPDADPGDGLLDVVAIADATPLRRLQLLGAATAGAHVRMPEVLMTRERTLDLRFPAPPEFEIDGDLHRAKTPEVRVRCMPGALRVVTSASFSATPDRPRESAR